MSAEHIGLKPRQEVVLRSLGIVLLHLFSVGMVIIWWGVQWIPSYFEFHENKGFLNPELISMAQIWFDLLKLGNLALIAICVGALFFDVLVVSLLVRSRSLQWLTDYWSTLIISLPLFCVIVTGTKMLDGYWGLQERIAQQRQRGVGQRGRDFQNLFGNWMLIAREKDGSRQAIEPNKFTLVIDGESYKWLTENGECLGSCNVYSSSDQNEMSFVPNEIDGKSWGGQGFYRVTATRLGLHLVNEPGFFDLSSFDTRTGGELWIFERK
jgi:hypothetical protein